jgi:hypothetical protein
MTKTRQALLTRRIVLAAAAAKLDTLRAISNSRLQQVEDGLVAFSTIVFIVMIQVLIPREGKR